MTPKRVTQRRTRLEKHFSDVFADLVGSIPQPEIARKYGVTPAAVTLFKQRNAEALEQAMNEVTKYHADTAIANKEYRIGELSSLYEVARAEIATAESHSDKAMMINTAAARLKQVAEELGQLPRPDQNINVKAMLLLREVSGTDTDVS